MGLSSLPSALLSKNSCIVARASFFWVELHEGILPDFHGNRTHGLAQFPWNEVGLHVQTLGQELGAGQNGRGEVCAGLSLECLLTPIMVVQSSENVVDPRKINRGHGGLQAVQHFV